MDSLTNEYHTYGLDWQPGSLKFYFDGKLFRTINQAPDYPMGMILNIYTDSGSGKHDSVFPKEWAVDYVRVYKKSDGYDLPHQLIKNRDNEQFMTLDTKSDKVILTATNEERSSWQLVPKGEYFLIKNTSTGEVLNIENQKGYLEHSELPETAWSSQWKMEEIDGYVRFVNRWKTDQVIHTENNFGYLEVGKLHSGAWRSQWKLE